MSTSRVFITYYNMKIGPALCIVFLDYHYILAARYLILVHANLTFQIYLSLPRAHVDEFVYIYKNSPAILICFAPNELNICDCFLFIMHFCFVVINSRVR